MPSLDEYLEKLAPAQRQQFERVRGIVRHLVPDAGERISYGIPTFTYRDRYVIYFAAFEHHMSVYPNVAGVEATPGTKGTFRFTADDPVPEEVVEKIVSSRMAQIDGRR